eukprot:TRINITY_DN67517_c2_g4_i1.p1 TRINITY_DN67517_c2_g4~~TRINITY_DN67517_c2_g4_i1.p1  ORF type:complete len:105 (-),score=8.86 TRINITY_DN67517_c2_g4_i1:192-506(-)
MSESGSEHGSEGSRTSGSVTNVIFENADSLPVIAQVIFEAHDVAYTKEIDSGLRNWADQLAEDTEFSQKDLFHRIADLDDKKSTQRFAADCLTLQWRNSFSSAP